MSLASEVRRAPRSRRRKQPVQPKWSPLDKILSADHPNQVLTFHEWCRLNRISERTGRRILKGDIAGDKGPVVTALTPKRIGITVADNAVWQQTRKRA
jgi:hypothetical protein